MVGKSGRVVGKFKLSEDEFDGLVRYASEGGMVTEWAKERGISYTGVMQWIHRDAARAEVWRGVEVARSQWFVQSVLAELRTIGLVDIREAYDERGAMKQVGDIPESVARAIVGIETEEEVGEDGEVVGRVRKVRFSDKLRALELLGKHLQMFIDNTRVLFQGKMTLEDLVCKSVGIETQAVNVEAITKGGGDGEVLSGADEQGSAGADKKGLGGDKDVGSGAGSQRADGVDTDELAPL